MALTYKDQATLVADTAWVDRVYAAACDVAQSVIKPADPGDASYSGKSEIAVNVAIDKAKYAQAFARLVAAGFVAVSAIAIPAVDTGSDGQIKTQVTAAFDALVR